MKHLTHPTGRAAFLAWEEHMKIEYPCCAYPDGVRAWLKRNDLWKRDVQEITTDHIRELSDPILTLKRGSRVQYLKGVRKFMAFCWHNSWIVSNPGALFGKLRLRDIPIEYKEERHRQIWTDDEFNKLRTYLHKQIKWHQEREASAPSRWCEHPWRIQFAHQHATRLLQFWDAAVMISRYIGLRLEVIALMDKGSLREPGKMLVWEYKTDKRVFVEVPPQVQEVIDATICQKFGGYCWPEAAEKCRAKAGAWLPAHFKTIVKRAGLVDRNFHDLRATCILDHANHLGIAAAQGLVGHASEAQTRAYLPAPAPPAPDNWPPHLPRPVVQGQAPNWRQVWGG